MSFIRAALACLLLLVASAAQAQAPSKAALDEVDRIFAAWQGQAPGLVYGVVANSALVHVAGLGVQDVATRRPVTADSLFRIASMSKAFTALAILKLRDEGRLSLDAAAETYVPEMKTWRYPTSDSPRITVRNLLTHTAGLVEDNPWGDRQQPMTDAEFTRLLNAGVAFASPPGTRMEYSNLGYAILGRIVGNLSGRRYQDYIRSEIMAPLHMDATGYDIFAAPPDRRVLGYRREGGAWMREPDMADGVFGAMGGVETSASDYASWVAFLLSAWPARDGVEAGPVKRGTVREIVTGDNFARGQAGGAGCAQASAYGLAWFVTGDCQLGLVLSHTGGYPGYGSAVMLLPDAGVGLFAFSSATYADVAPPLQEAAIALQRAGALTARPEALSPGLSAAYDAARAVWRSGDIAAGPLADNVLLDRPAAAWKTMLANLKARVGDCPGTESITPSSAMEGRFAWTCERGRVTGRVQRAPSSDMTLQVLEFIGG